MKSIKYDADKELDISSYDIVSIAWNMPEANLSVTRGKELLLIANARSYLRELLINDSYRAGLKVPNGMRTVFGDAGATKAQLGSLLAEVDELAKEIEAALTRSYRKIQEAIVPY